MTARRLGALGGLAALALGAIGCSTVVEGAAVKDPTVARDAVNTALLQPGNHPTVPQAPPAPSPREGARVEAQRMADHVVVPWEVDPALTQPLVTTISPGLVPTFLNLVLREPGADIAAAHGFINAFSSGRADTETDERRTELINVVMRFPTDQDAASVANEMHQQLQPPLDSSSYDPIALAGHPEALAKKAVRKDGRTVVTSFTPHGPYVLFQEAISPDGPRAESLVLQTLDMQLPAIDSFQPTDTAQLATMDTDPTHLWSRTLQTGESIPAMGVYGPHGVLHFMQPIVQQWLDTAGVDAVSLGRGNRVYQTRDAAAANGLADNIAKDLSDEAKPASSVPGMPSAKCFFAPDSGALLAQYSCVAPAGRWVIVTASQQERDAAQQLAAQYLMLVGK